MMNVDNIILQGEYYEYEKRYIERYNKTIRMRKKRELYKDANDNLIEIKKMILDDMIKTNVELKKKYGKISEMESADIERQKYWNEGVQMTYKLENKYNEVLGIKEYTKCGESCADLCCCYSGQYYIKKLFKSLYFLIKCICICCKKTIEKKEEIKTKGKKTQVEGEV